MTTTTTTLQAGSLCFYDSVTAGLVPCRIVHVDQYTGFKRVLMQVTAARGCYPRGHLIDADGSTKWVLPRTIRRVRGSYGQRVIVPPVEFIADRGC